MEVVYNTSGPYAGSGKRRRDESAAWGVLEKRKGGTLDCKVVYSVDERVNVTGTPALLYNNTGTAPAGRSDGMGALVWILVFSVGGAVSGYLRVEELHIIIRHMAYLEYGVLKGWDLGFDEYKSDVYISCRFLLSPTHIQPTLLLYCLLSFLIRTLNTFIITTIRPSSIICFRLAAFSLPLSAFSYTFKHCYFY